MPRWAVEFAYDGRPFGGWARQPGRRTIEGEIRSGLARCGLASSPDAARLEVASRTDRGVSARANVLALTSERPGGTVLRALNAIAPELYFRRAAEVSAAWSVRRARHREYRYFEASGGRDLAALRRSARLFSGRLDVRSLGRGLPGAGPVWRDVDWVRVHRSAGTLRLDVRAPSFVWGMVRKIVGALREVEAGRLTEAALREALAGERRLTLPMAEADPLVLWEVDLGLEFTVEAPRPTRGQRRRADEEGRAAAARSEVVRAVYGSFGTERAAGAVPSGATARP